MPRVAPSHAAPSTVRFDALAHHLEEQIRGSTNPATVNRYRQAMQSGETFPPLTVAEVAGALILVDGFHRRDALEALGKDDAPAMIVPCASLKEARWRGFEANLRHGQPLRAKHMRPALNAYLEAGLHRAGGRLKSYRELAAELPGVGYSTIRRWIERDHPELFREMGGAENAGPGGLVERAQPMTAEEMVAAKAWEMMADAKALLVSLPPAMRHQAAADAEVLLRELRWDEEGAKGLDLGAFLGPRH